MNETPAIQGHATQVRRTELVAIAGIASSAALTVLLGVSIGYTEVDIWGAFIVPSVLATVTLPFLARSKWLRDEGLVGITSLALIAKFVGSFLRYIVAYHVYDGNDSGRYHIAGVSIAEEYLGGQRSFISLWPTATGTQYIEQLNGLVALFTGRSILASFMFFSWLSFFGMLGFVAAARWTLPGVRLHRYAMAVFLLPSMAFWPSSLGKDAWMVFGLGMMAVGLARVISGSMVGSIWFLLGGYATAVVRPHVTALVLASLTVSILGRRGNPNRHRGFVVSIVLAAAVAAFAASRAIAVLPGLGDGLGGVLEATQERSSQGGSEIDAAAPNTPLEYPYALLTVLFRPFLWEAANATALLSAIEGSVLLAVVVTKWRRIAGGLREAASNAYLRFASAYVLGFGFAWSSIGNLGIIARQRVQVLPLLLLFLFLADRSSQVRDPRAVPTGELAR